MDATAALDEPTCPVELAAKYERLAWRVANKYRRWVRPADFEDSVQVARLAVFKAARMWDRGLGVKFISYAWRAIENDLRRWRLVIRRRGLTFVGDGYVLSGGGPAPELPTETTQGRNDGGELADIFSLVRAPEPDPPALRWPTQRWRELLSPLSPPQRQVIVGLFLQGRTERDIAGEMGVTRTRVWQHKLKAFETLRLHHPRLAEAL